MIHLNYATASGGSASGTEQSGSGQAVTSGPSAGGSAPSASGTSVGGNGLLPIIRRRLSRRGSIEIDPRSNSLIITDVPTNLRAIRQLIDSPADGYTIMLVANGLTANPFLYTQQPFDPNVEEYQIIAPIAGG